MKTILIFAILLLTHAAIFGYAFLGPKWPGQNPMVEYYINEEGSPDIPDEIPLLQRAFSAWEVEGTAISTKYLGTINSRAVAPNHQNILKWEESNGFSFDRNVIAVCYYWYTSSSLTDFDIVFNGRDFSWSTTGEAGKMDVGHIATHEVGHALGMAHSADQSAVMWYTSAYGDTSHRTLYSDDSLGICALYPRTCTNNHPPVITSSPVTETISGEKYEYQVTAIDADDDPIKFRLTTKPLNMRIDSLTGKIVWYPKFLDIGAHTVVVEAYDKYNGIGRQTYSVRVSDLVVFTRDTAIGFADTLWYPVYVTNMEGYNIIAGNIEISYREDQLTVLDIDTTGSIIAGTSYAKNITKMQTTCGSILGVIKFAFAAATPYTGQGPLFRIKMLVNKEYCGEPLVTTISKAFFNDGDPVATTSNGEIFMQCGCSGGGYSYNIDGRVLYEANQVGVENAILTLSTMDETAYSNGDGYYEFVQVPRSNLGYTVSLSKDSGDVRNAISAYDASLILRNVVDLISLNTFKHQIQCADVNANNMITAFDAALILRYVVEYNDATSIGTWVAVPASQNLSTFLKPVHGLNFNMYLIGDVSGNWNDFNTEMPKRNTDAAACLTMTSILDTIQIANNQPEEALAIDVTYKDIEAVYAGEFNFGYNTAAYTVSAIRFAPLLKGFTCVSNIVDGAARIAFAGAQPIEHEGSLFQIVLTAKGSAPIEEADKDVAMNFVRFNELTDGQIRVEKRSMARTRVPGTGIMSLSPNPFNPAVNIAYEVEKKQHLELAIFDLHGKRIVTLVSTLANAGAYRAVWNGKDAQGRAVASGIYLVRYSTDATKAIGKLYLMK